MLGDSTAYMLGRVTLNPFKHIDPVGTIAVPLGLLLLSRMMGGSGLLFGWAKPVPVNFGNLRDPKSDMFWVAAAGPGANLFMALLWAIALKVGGPLDHPTFLQAMAIQGVTINVVLMVLNLMPIPPLDGGRIVVSLLPHQLAYRFAQIERFGFMLVILLMALLWALALKLGGPFEEPAFLAAMAIEGIKINVILMVLNLLPIPPLDGGRIMVSVLPRALAFQFAKAERFGFIVVILLLATGVLNVVMAPLVRGALELIITVFGL
jgi:Zn-dependent protease